MDKSRRHPVFAEYEIKYETHLENFGVVHVLFNPISKEVTLLKSLLIEHVGLDTVNSIKKRIEVLKQANFPFVVHWTHYIQDEKYLHFFRPFINAPSLQEYISQHQEMDSKRILLLWRKIVEYINYLHYSRIFPSVIKPSNIFILNENQIILTDLLEPLGDSRILLQTAPTNHFLYFAPEYFNNRSEMTKESDVWSIGVILMSMFGVSIPWKTKNIFALVKLIMNTNEIPIEDPDVSSIVNTLLMKNPKERPNLDDVLSNHTTVINRRNQRRNSLENNEGGLPLLGQSKQNYHSHSSFPQQKGLVSPITKHQIPIISQVKMRRNSVTYRPNQVAVKPILESIQEE